MTYAQSSLRIGDTALPAHTLDVIGSSMLSGPILAGASGPTIACTTATPGDMISAQGASLGDRYGIGKYSDNVMRMFASQTLATAGIALSLASTNSAGPTGTFTDLLSLKAGGATCSVPLSVTGSVTAGSMAVTGTTTLAGLIATSFRPYTTNTTITGGPGGSSGDYLQINGGSGTTGIVVNNSSQVGIGTNAPAYTLDVSGTVRTTGAASIASLSVAGTSVLAATTVTALTCTGNASTTGSLLVGGNAGFGGLTTPAYAIDATGVARASQVLVGTSTDNASYRLFSALNGNLAANGVTYLCFGQAASNLNQAELSFFYSGASSTSNAFRIGFFTSTSQLCYTAGGMFGVNTTSPAYSCDVNGTMRISGASTLAATTCTSLSASGAATLAAASCTSLANSGATILSSTLSVTGTTTMAGVTASSMASTGALSATGAASFGSTLSVAGATTLASLTVSGSTTFSGACNLQAILCTTLTSSGAGSVGGALTVAGAATASSLTTSGAISQTGGANHTLSGGASGGTGPRVQLFGGGGGGTTGIDLSGYGGLCWSVTATDNGSYGASLDFLAVSGQGATATNRMHFNAANSNVGFGGNTSPSYTVDVTGTFRASGAATLGTLAVTGATTLSGSLSVTGATTLAGLVATSFKPTNTNTTISCGPGGSTPADYLQITGGSGTTGLVVSYNSQVGIGTTSPAYTLDVTGSIRSTGTATFGGLSVSGGISFSTLTASGAVSLGSLTVSGASVLAALTASSVASSGTLTVAGAASLSSSLVVAGNAGFGGLTSPAYPVDVTGAVRAVSLLAGNSTDTNRLVSALNSNQQTGTTAWLTLGQSASLLNQAEVGFLYAGSGSTANTLSLGFYSSTSRVYYTAGGNLGVGQPTPAYNCDVSGSLRATGAAVIGGGLNVTGPSNATADSITNSLLVGALGFGTWAGVMNSAMSQTGYALLQSTGGTTIVNNVAGAGILFRDSNNTGGTYTNGSLRIGDASLPAATLDIAGSARVSGRVGIDRLDEPVSKGIIAQYTFKAGSGAVVYDQSPIGNHGSIGGTYAWSSSNPYDGLSGAYLNFSDQSGVILPTTTIGSANLTVSLWYNPSAGSSGNNVLVNNGPNRNLIDLQVSTMTVGMYLNGFVDSGVGLSVGSWYHLCAVATTSGSTVTYSLYVNGRSVLSTTNAFSPATYPITAFGNYMTGNTSSNGQCAQGKLEDIRVWSRGLSSVEVVRLYGARSGGVYRDVNTGYMGMGTSTPAYTCDVNGALRVTGTQWFNNQIQNQMVCLFTQDSALSSTSTNYYGFGVNQNVLRYNVPVGQNHAWYAGAPEIARINATGLGVLKAPTCALDVAGTVQGTSLVSTGTLAVTGTSTLTGNVFVGSASATANNVYVQTSGSGVGSIGCDSSNSYGASMGISGGSFQLGWCVGGGLGVYNPSQARMVLNTSSQLGINTINPSYNCDISGTLRSTGAAIISGGLSTTTISQSGNHTFNAPAAASGSAGPRMQMYGSGGSGATTGIDLSGYGGQVWSITATDNGSYSANLDILAVPGQNASQTNRMHFNGANSNIGVGGQTNPQYTLDVNGGIRQSLQVHGHWTLTTSQSIPNQGLTTISGSDWSLSWGTFVNTSASAVLTSSGQIVFPFRGMWNITMQATFTNSSNSYGNAAFFIVNTYSTTGVSGNTSTANRLGTSGGYGLANALCAHTGIFNAGDAISPTALSNSNGNSVATGGNSTLTITLITPLN